MSAPVVDVVIPVHDPVRPIERAVASVLDHTDTDVRVTVVAHELDPAAVRQRLGRDEDARLRVLGHADGRRSPSGPFNAGLDAADGEYTSVMGSDDTLQPHAIDSWVALAARTKSEVVIARLRHAGGRAVPTPPTRALRSTRLDGVRDRLAYRSAPLGLVSRRRFGELRFATDVPTGEDIPYVTAVWFSGAQIAYDRWGPAYLIHDDGGSRVTFAGRPLAEEFRWWSALAGDPWFLSLPDASRRAIVTKLIRIQLFGAIHYRPDAASWTTAERTELAAIAAQLLEHGAGAERALSRRDRALLDAALDATVPAERLLAASAARRRFGNPASLLPRELRAMLAREAPLRYAAATTLQLR